ARRRGRFARAQHRRRPDFRLRPLLGRLHGRAVRGRLFESGDGAGVIAGGPYFCAQGRLEIASPNCVCFPILACTFVPITTRNIPRLIEITDRNAESGAIDDTANLRAHRVWMFSGKFDSTVRQEVVDDLRTYYLHYVDAANIAHK